MSEPCTQPGNGEPYPSAVRQSPAEGPKAEGASNGKWRKGIWCDPIRRIESAERGKQPRAQSVATVLSDVMGNTIGEHRQQRRQQSKGHLRSAIRRAKEQKRQVGQNR